MFGWVKYGSSLLIFLFLVKASVAGDRQFNLGTIATPSEVDGWNIDVRPDGLVAPK